MAVGNKWINISCAHNKLWLKMSCILEVNQSTQLRTPKLYIYKSVLWGKMNGRIGNSKFNLLRMLLYFGAISSFIIGKHMQKSRKENIK